MLNKLQALSYWKLKDLGKMVKIQMRQLLIMYSIYRKNSKNWDTLNYYRNCPTN